VVDVVVVEVVAGATTVSDGAADPSSGASPEELGDAADTASETASVSAIGSDAAG